MAELMVADRHLWDVTECTWTRKQSQWTDSTEGSYLDQGHNHASAQAGAATRSLHTGLKQTSLFSVRHQQIVGIMRNAPFQRHSVAVTL